MPSAPNPTILIVLITLLAGLGLIFVGTHFLTVNMKQAAGPSFRKLVRRATENPFKAGLVGFASGALIQSTNAVTYIVVGLVSAGAITVTQGLPIVTWCYTGTTLRLFLVSLDLKVITLGLVAVIGILYGLGYNKSHKHGYLVAAGLGLALLMLGVDLTARAGESLRDSQGIRNVLSRADQFFLWGLIAGTILASFLQGMTVSIIALALAQAGVLPIEQAMMIVVGANLGSGIMSAVQGAALKGSERQLTLYQVVLKAIGAAVMVPLMTLEHYTGIPTVRGLIMAITGDVAFQLTLVHWMFQITAALVASPLNPVLVRFVGRLSPPSEEEALSRPQFLTIDAEGRPAEAPQLVEQEQLRLVRRLPDYLAGLRKEEHGEAASLEALQNSGKALIGDIDRFLKSALAADPQEQQLDRLLQLWNAADTLGALQDSVAGFANAMPKPGRDPVVDRFIGSLTEGMHAMLETATMELEEGERVDAVLIDQLTADRAELMQQMRDEQTRQDPPLPAAERRALWQATELFERVTWLLRRYAWNLGAISVGAPTVSEPAVAKTM
jgi:phosphate:Na+ symporter